MASATTNYDIKIEYAVNDRALSRATNRVSALEKGLIRTQKVASKVFKRGMFAGAAGLGFMVKSGIDFNRQMQQTQASMTTILQRTQGMQRSFAKSSASGMIKDLKELAKTSPGTFQEMTNFAKEIAPAIGNAGGEVDDIKKLASLGTVAASAFGIDKDVAARDVRQALTKGITSKDLLPMLLGLEPESFNKLGKAARLTELQRALDTKDIRQAAEEFKTSFEGVFSTFKSNLQEFNGAVTSKLFSALNKQLMDLNAWVDKNPQKIQKFASEMADMLASAFEKIQSVFQFIIDNKSLIMPVLGTLAAGKLVTGVTGVFGAFGGSLGALATKANLAAGALGAAYLGAKVWFNGVDKRQDARLEAITKNQFGQFYTDQAANFKSSGGTDARAGRLALQQAEAAGIIRNGKIIEKASNLAADASERDRSKVYNDLRFLLEKRGQIIEDIGRMKQMTGQVVDFMGAFHSGMSKLASLPGQVISGLGKFMDMSEEDFKKLTKATKNAKDKGDKNRSPSNNIKMTVNVASDDPDRFAIGLEDFFGEAVANPSAAATVFREGK